MQQPQQISRALRASEPADGQHLQGLIQSLPGKCSQVGGYVTKVWAEIFSLTDVLHDHVNRACQGATCNM